jgi:hypothetical protein
MRRAAPRRCAEAAFAEAVLDPASAAPLDVVAPGGGDAARRFSVYRNNVVVGLVDALARRFPVVERVVGAEFFRAMARLYVTVQPPRSPLLFRYGDTFPAFVERFPPAASLPWLADLARLELARGRAYHAADVVPLASAAFAGQTTEDLTRVGVRLHPSVTLISSPYPIVSIWKAHDAGAKPNAPSWMAEAALVARPALAVEVRLLPPGGYRFLISLSERASLARAAELAAAEAPDFDPVRNLALLIESRIAVELRKTPDLDLLPSLGEGGRGAAG